MHRQIGTPVQFAPPIMTVINGLFHESRAKIHIHLVTAFGPPVRDYIGTPEIRLYSRLNSRVAATKIIVCENWVARNNCIMNRLLRMVEI